MKRNKPLVAKTPLARSTAPMRRVPIKRFRSNGGRHIVTQFDGPAPVMPRRSTRKRGANDIPAESRAAVMKRSHSRCELGLPVCTGRAATMHHRKLRRAGDHTPINLLDLCDSCHRWIHDHTGVSYQNGWLVRQHDDPAAIPVLRDGATLGAVAISRGQRQS